MCEVVSDVNDKYNSEQKRRKVTRVFGYTNQKFRTQNFT